MANLTIEQIKEMETKLAAPFMQEISGKLFNDVYWLPQREWGDKLICLPYLRKHQVVKRLNEVFGIGGWQSTIKEGEKGTKLCTISALFGDVWVDRTDIGTASKTEAEKGSVSDAIKRTATQFGIGAYLVDMKEYYINAVKNSKGKLSPCDDNKKLLHGDKLKDYINKIVSPYGAFRDFANQIKPLINNNPELLGAMKTIKKFLK